MQHPLMIGSLLLLTVQNCHPNINHKVLSNSLHAKYQSHVLIKSYLLYCLLLLVLFADFWIILPKYSGFRAIGVMVYSRIPFYVLQYFDKDDAMERQSSVRFC